MNGKGGAEVGRLAGACKDSGVGQSRRRAFGKGKGCNQGVRLLQRRDTLPLRYKWHILRSDGAAVESQVQTAGMEKGDAVRRNSAR